MAMRGVWRRGCHLLLALHFFFVVGGGTVTVQVCSGSSSPLLANILPSMLLLLFYVRSASKSGHWELRGKGRCGAFVEVAALR